MTTDPLYDEVSPMLCNMNQQELAAEEQAAREALFRLVLQHIDQPNYRDAHTISAEARLLEVQLALNLKVRDATLEQLVAQEVVNTGRPITAQAERTLRTVVHSGFQRDIDRIADQLARCRESLSGGAA